MGEPFFSLFFLKNNGEKDEYKGIEARTQDVSIRKVVLK